MKSCLAAIGHSRFLPEAADSECPLIRQLMAVAASVRFAGAGRLGGKPRQANDKGPRDGKSKGHRSAAR